MIVVTYPSFGGPECRAFLTRETAERWAIVAGYGGRSTLYDSEDVRLYRCRAYSRRCPLFPVVAYRAGHFLSPYHCDRLLDHWSGYNGAKVSVRYEYDECIDEELEHYKAFEIVDHRDTMAVLNRIEYRGRADRTANLTFSR